MEFSCPNAPGTGVTEARLTKDFDLDWPHSQALPGRCRTATSNDAFRPTQGENDKGKRRCFDTEDRDAPDTTQTECTTLKSNKGKPKTSPLNIVYMCQNLAASLRDNLLSQTLSEIQVSLSLVFISFLSCCNFLYYYFLLLL